jgi:pyruvate/2-oxoglutarate dehydrogenase complex dihydrolipoamide acyltransferase (E2) component
VAEGKISKWFVAAGDSIQPGQNLFEIETDKVSMEVPAIAAGTLAAIHVQAGEVVPVGAVVAVIQGSGEVVSTAKPQTPLTPAPGSAQSAARVQAPAGIQGQEKKELGPRFRGDERAEAPRPSRLMEPFREVRSPERNYGPARLPGGTVVTPLARRLAGEAGIDLANVKGSGPRGRIVAADVEQARKAPALAAVQAVMPIVLTADIALVQALALCAETKLTLADVIVKAWALALSRASLDASAVLLNTGEGRAAIRDAANKSLSAIGAARDARAPQDQAPASTAISIPGVAGIVSVADVLRPPQVALLGLGATRRAPVEAADGAIRFVDMATATLTCDSAALDAARAAALLAAFKGFVEKPVTMLV